MLNLSFNEIDVCFSIVYEIVIRHLNTETDVETLLKEVPREIKYVSEELKVSEEKISASVNKKEASDFIRELFTDFVEHGCKNPYDKTLWDENGEYIGE